MSNSEIQTNSYFNYLDKIVFAIIIPLLSLFPIIINLVNDFQLRKVKTKSKKCGLFIFNLIIDIVLFLTVLLQSLTECEEYCTNLFSNNYWLMVYKLYIGLYFGNILNTISSCFCVINTWNRYYVMNDYKISNNIIFSILIIQFLFSFISHLPNLFLTEIQFKSNESNFTSSTYELKSIQNNVTLDIIFKIHVAITSIIFIISLILVMKLLFLMQEKINSKFSDDDACAENLVIKRCHLKSLESITLYQRLSSLNPEELDLVLSHLKTCKLESETSMFVFLITLIFAIDQFFKNLSVTLTFFYIFACLFALILSVQLIQLFINFKFNQCFSKRLKFLYQKIIRAKLNSRRNQ